MSTIYGSGQIKTRVADGTDLPVSGVFPPVLSAGTGTVQVFVGQRRVVGTGTTFSTEMYLGQKVLINGQLNEVGWVADALSNQNNSLLNTYFETKDPASANFSGVFSIQTNTETWKRIIIQNVGGGDATAAGSTLTAGQSIELNDPSGISPFTYANGAGQLEFLLEN